MIPFDIDPHWLADRAGGVALALLIFTIGWLISRTAHRLVLKAIPVKRFDQALAGFLANVVRYAVLAAAVIAALDTVGVKTTSFAAILASAGVAIGLALQGSLSNFASGVLILILRPFDIGQYVTVSGQSGTVTDIGLFATTLTGLGNEQIIIPNAQITSDVIVNFTAQANRRGSVKVGVAYGSDVKRVEEVLLRAAGRVDLVLKEPAPFVRFTNLGASSLDFEVFAWAAREDWGLMVHELRRAVYEELGAEGIEIPFNQVVVRTVGAVDAEAAA